MIFTTWWDSPIIRCQIIFYKMFVKKVFQLVKPFLRIFIFLFPNNTHICTQWPQKFLNSFSAYEYPKYAEFHADFKSVDIIEKSTPRKSYLPKTFASWLYRKDKIQFCTLFLPITFLLANFSHFFNSFKISVKFCVVLIPIFKCCEEKFVWPN